MTATQFKQTFLPYSGQLYRMALRLTGNQQAAEDLVQDTYLRLWTHRDDLPKNLSPFAYALTSMRHIYYDRLRKGSIEESDEPVERQLSISAGVDVGKQVENSDLCDRFRQLIGLLPENQRQVMTMRDIEGMPTSQIQELTGLSEANVRTLLCRARTMVKQQFKKLTNGGC